jgi:hypothetical protein
VKGRQRPARSGVVEVSGGQTVGVRIILKANRISWPTRRIHGD